MDGFGGFASQFFLCKSFTGDALNRFLKAVAVIGLRVVESERLLIGVGLKVEWFDPNIRGV